MILNEMKGHIRNAIGYLRERPFGQDKIDNATEEINKAIESMSHEENIYLIELDRFNISNDNTNATETTIGINNAIIYAKENGYTGAKLPQGHYAIDTAVKNDIVLCDDTGDKWTCHRGGITMQSDIDFYMDNAILEMIPTEDPYYEILNITHCDNISVVGGTILGDRDTHYYGHRINDNGNELESGDIDSETGLPIADETKVRTINYIDNYYGGELPTKFRICPLENTSMNTVDGGCRYIYCYDENDNYLGMTNGGIGFLSEATLVEGTKKIKVSFKGEKRLDAKYYMTTRGLYYTHEFGSGITARDSHNIKIDGVTIKNCVGDCICTTAPPLKVTVDNLEVVNCTLENSRRQGISFVATGENYLIKGCNIGRINGTDPQCGVDFEHYDYVRNTVFDNCNFYDNKKWDIINYNGWDIEIKNCNFNGGIGTTYGYNMDIHDNHFSYEDNINKIHKYGLFSLATNKTDEDGAYFKIYNNTIENYMKEDKSGGGGSTSSLSNSEFKNNIVRNTCIVVGSNVANNTYENCYVRYSKTDYEYKNEKFINCIIGGENNSSGTVYRYYNNFDMYNCEFTGGSPSVADTILTNCKIYNNDRSFNKTWSGKYTLDNCTITTEYTTNIAFLSNQGSKATYTNCIMNLSATPFVAINYSEFVMSNCEITFNESYQGDNTTFFRNGYGTYSFENNKFYKSFDNPKIVLPSSSTVNDVYYEEGVTV